MKSLHLLLLAVVCAGFAMTLSAKGASEREKPSATPELKKMEIVVQNEVISKVNPDLFGQFMERSFGDPGPEGGLMPGTNCLRPEIAEKLKSMDIPLIRFPGGTDVDFLDWRNLIDNVPGRDGGRPVSKNTLGKAKMEMTNRFGYDEYFTQVRDVLGCKTIVTLNFLDAVAACKPIKRAALDSCGLLAYLNAPQGAKLPDGMPDWPAVRAKNGHPSPFGIEYIQIGNETWTNNFWEPVKKALEGKPDEELAARYLECLREYVRVIREIDPKVSIIIDLRMPFGAAKQVYEDPYVLKNANLMAYHIYQMGPMNQVEKNGKNFPASAFSNEDIWNYWTMLPTWFGDGVADHFPREEPGLKAGLKIACTEWNWVRWNYAQMDPKPPFTWELPAAIGVARHLHGMIRAGDRLALGTQSTLVGAGWAFAAVRFDRDSVFSPHFSAQGQVTNFYRHTVGKDQLKLCFVKGMETMQMHFPSDLGTQPVGAAFDPLATRDRDKVLLHIVNRYRENPVEMTLQLEGFADLPPEAKLYELSADLKMRKNQHEEIFKPGISTIKLSGNTASLHFAKPGIYMIEIPLARKR